MPRTRRLGGKSQYMRAPPLVRRESKMGLRMTWRLERKPVHLIWHKTHGELVCLCGGLLIFLDTDIVHRRMFWGSVGTEVGHWDLGVWKWLKYEKSSLLICHGMKRFWHLSPAIYHGYTYQNCRRTFEFVNEIIITSYLRWSPQRGAGLSDYGHMTPDKIGKSLSFFFPADNLNFPFCRNRKKVWRLTLDIGQGKKDYTISDFSKS